MRDLTAEVAELFAEFEATYELGEDVIVAVPAQLRDPHPGADEFLAATPEERALICARYTTELERKRVAARLKRVEAARPRRKGGQQLTRVEERAIRELARGGLSVREIGRRTGIGRATVSRRLAGIEVQKRGRKRAA